MKIINDPVHGFIKIPKGLLLQIIQHPLMQRLTRIRQLGMSSFVYPGAQHTRFQHSIGAYYLTTEAVLTLAQKGIFIFDSEAEAVEAAILMHDIGHGPFSHVLENTLISGISHEEISLKMMEQINDDLGGQLNLALSIFKDKHHKRFLHQLISSQLDMDRLDYLSRDSFFTGVQEGVVGGARILKMLNVVDDQLVIDEKGIYSIENYLTSRRSMYWQVYLHKTVVACEKVLVNLLMRAKYLASHGMELFCSPYLKYFIYNDIDKNIFETTHQALYNYAMLDDNDIWSAIKVWANHDDKILRMLSKALVTRRQFKVEVFDEPVTEHYIAEVRHKLAELYEISWEDTKYLYSVDAIKKNMYDIDGDSIKILLKTGVTQDICEVSDLLNAALLCHQKPKYYLSFYRLETN
ncbi:MAG: HD domain-containing protein [Bacteroidales bacterium]|nr:HD domain-containing protein [Bacteroidales bacterium]MCM1147489.1 HD domain-containing protein [Bacteroidales bacterium]MCM1206158.1 HD domain-containing protein [Bacillota bacterium]MCM1510010.1 HD domain-containing protein [Clostridium sp.]